MTHVVDLNTSQILSSISTTIQWPSSVVEIVQDYTYHPYCKVSLPNQTHIVLVNTCMSILLSTHLISPVLTYVTKATKYMQKSVWEYSDIKNIIDASLMYTSCSAGMYIVAFVWDAVHLALVTPMVQGLSTYFLLSVRKNAYSYAFLVHVICAAGAHDTYM